MSVQQLVLSLVLATMVFAVALELKPDDFRRVTQQPRAVVAGLIPQFILFHPDHGHVMPLVFLSSTMCFS